LYDSINNKEWKLTKLVLPQHTDHAGVMWHGSYFDFLEEGRIDALNKIGITYSGLSKKGYEIPVISAQIKYKISFTHGEEVLLLSQFKFLNKIRFNCKTFFLKVNGDIAAEAMLDLVIVRKKNDSIKLVRELPEDITKMLLLLEKGAEN
tara:strand:+ start:189 stop:635 length:447 start_codon:yes stop_codon:yes gene_type:complete